MFLLLAPAHPAGAAPPLLVLGDSISAAYGMSLEQGWVALLERRLQEDYPEIGTVNASISGDTSAGGLRRLPQLLEEHRPQLLVIELGGNDGLRGYPVGQLADNLRAMVELGTAAGATVLVLPMEIPPNYGPRYTDAFRRAFLDAAALDGAQLGPFPLGSFATDASMMQSDGIHPTIAAQPLIVDTVLPAIREALEAAPGT